MASSVPQIKRISKTITNVYGYCVDESSASKKLIEHRHTVKTHFHNTECKSVKQNVVKTCACGSKLARVSYTRSTKVVRYYTPEVCVHTHVPCKAYARKTKEVFGYPPRHPDFDLSANYEWDGGCTTCFHSVTGRRERDDPQIR